MNSPKVIKAKRPSIQMPKEPMQVMVITVTKRSTRFVAKMDEIPDNTIIRMQGIHWDRQSKP